MTWHQSLGHKGPVLWPRCIGTKGSNPVITVLYSTSHKAQKKFFPLSVVTPCRTKVTRHKYGHHHTLPTAQASFNTAGIGIHKENLAVKWHLWYTLLWSCESVSGINKIARWMITETTKHTGQYTCYSLTPPYCYVQKEMSVTYLLTHSMQHSPSWEANQFAATQEIPHILWNPKVHYHIHKCPPPVSILS
jgi:hypothetical protein